MTTACLSQQSPREGTQQEASVPDGQASDASRIFSMDLDALSNVKVITASKFEQNVTVAPSDISVVTKDELRRFGGITLIEILERVAGLTASSAYFDRSTLAVRGDQTRTDSGHVLILIDGRPVREVLEGGASSDLLESFPVNILERIEVIKGPGSVLYGSDAYSGVINLITQKADGDGFHVSGAGGGSGLAAGSEEIFLKRGDFNLVEGAQYHQMPRWNAVFLSQPVPSNLAYSQAATVWENGEGGYLGLNYKGLTLVSSYTGFEDASFIRGLVSDVRSKRGFADIGYAFQASDKWRMTFNFTYTRTEQDAPEYPHAHRDSHEADLEWTNYITFSERDRLTLGAVITDIEGNEWYSGEQPALLVENGKRWGSGLYAQHEHELTENLKLIAGLQANKSGEIAWDVIPRAGIVWNPAEHFTLKALYGSAFRAPSLDETGITHPGLRGDEDLVPEKVGTLDLQASYQNNRVLVSVDYFHSRESNLIFHNGAVHPAVYYNLTAPATFQGIDSEGKVYVGRNWFLIGSALYQTNHDRAIAPLSPIPSLGVKAGVSFSSKGGADVSVFDGYQGHIGGYASATNPPPDAFHSVSAHARFDLSKHWMRESAEGFALFLHGDDLANTQIWLPAWGSNSSNTMPGVQGRTIYFGMEVWQKQ